LFHCAANLSIVFKVGLLLTPKNKTSIQLAEILTEQRLQAFTTGIIGSQNNKNWYE
jgi:hypothetical protein